MRVTEITVPVRMPRCLAAEVRRLAEQDSSSLSATMRRLIARGISQERQLWGASVAPHGEGEVVSRG